MNQSRHVPIVCLAGALALTAGPVGGPTPAVLKVLDLFQAAANRRVIESAEKVIRPYAVSTSAQAQLAVP
jgi:hypothetical protein